VPSIALPAPFESIINFSDYAIRFMFSERNGIGFHDALRSFSEPESVLALIGSEGGWADEELTTASNLGWQIVTLGGRILRAETAAITATVLLEHQWGDLR
jgi:16S rRNA (uracil1498-N3)-methyltransferase